VASIKIRETVEELYPSLAGQQRRAAAFLLANHRTMFGLSVQGLARAADVSEATLVRFARRLGFSGYLEMRAALVEEAKAGLRPEERFAYEEPSAEAAGTVSKVARQEVDNINRTVEGVDAAKLQRFVRALKKADVVVTLGLGVSAILARLAAYQLFQAGLRSEVLTRDVMTLVEQVERLPRTSVVLALGFPPYSRQTIDALVRAGERKIPVLAITDSPASPLAKHAAVTLYARTDNILYTNGISGVIVLLNALATELALANKAKALSRLQATSRGLDDEYVET
jgi:DNA-binding MurR/RpiR family transcriptional regulator